MAKAMKATNATKAATAKKAMTRMHTNKAMKIMKAMNTLKKENNMKHRFDLVEYVFFDVVSEWRDFNDFNESFDVRGTSLNRHMAPIQNYTLLYVDSGPMCVYQYYIL